MQLKFHGARGSHPVSPTPARVEEIIKSVWELSHAYPSKNWEEFRKRLVEMPRSQYQIWGGNTTCLELKSDQSTMPIFFDAGTGLTSAGMDPESALMRPEFFKGSGKLAIFFSHTHWDHIAGLVTLEQLYKGNEFHFYGVHKGLSKRLSTLFLDEYFPVPFRVVEPHFKFHEIPLNMPIQIGGLSINHIPQSHPGGSFAYRVSDGKKSFVFATDTELKNVNPPHMNPGANLYTNADALILDAQFSPEDFPQRQGYGHSEIFAAVDFAVREKAKILYLFHQSPYYTDKQLDEQLVRARAHKDEKHGKNHPMQIFMALEGDQINV